MLSGDDFCVDFPSGGEDVVLESETDIRLCKSKKENMPTEYMAIQLFITCQGAPLHGALPTENYGSAPALSLPQVIVIPVSP